MPGLGSHKGSPYKTSDAVLSGGNGANARLQDREPYFRQIFKGWIIKSLIASCVFRITWWDYDHHTLPGTGQKNSIGVLEVELPFTLSDPIPSISAKRPMFPPLCRISEISVPGDACPIQLETLYVKFRGNVFKII